MAKYSNYASLQGKKSLKSTLIIEPIFFKLKKKKKKKKKKKNTTQHYKRRNVMSTIFSQHFHNKSYVTGCNLLLLMGNKVILDGFKLKPYNNLLTMISCINIINITLL